MKEIKDVVETLTGNRPEEVEENCGSIWFKTDGKWYYISINECENENVTTILEKKEDKQRLANIKYTQEHINEIACNIADEMLQMLIPVESERIVHETDTNSTYYTDSAQDTFNELYDIIENIIKE